MDDVLVMKVLVLRDYEAREIIRELPPGNTRAVVISQFADHVLGGRHVPRNILIRVEEDGYVMLVDPDMEEAYQEQIEWP
jgi:hypothetical protein